MISLHDPIAWRGIERTLIACAGVFFGALGYRLFVLGLRRGKGQLDARSQFFRIVFSGEGPGLLFMLAGALILLVAVFKGGAESRSTRQAPGYATVERLEATAPREDHNPTVIFLNPSHPAFQLQKTAKQGKVDRSLCKSLGGKVLPYADVDFSESQGKIVDDLTINWWRDPKTHAEYVGCLFSESAPVGSGLLLATKDLQFCFWPFSERKN